MVGAQVEPEPSCADAFLASELARSSGKKHTCLFYLAIRLSGQPGKQPGKAFQVGEIMSPVADRAQHHLRCRSE